MVAIKHNLPTLSDYREKTPDYFLKAVLIKNGGKAPAVSAGGGNDST